MGTLYSKKTSQNVQALSELQVPQDFTIDTIKTDLYTDRYLSDMHYGKDGTFFHHLRNTNPEKHTLVLYLQDFFIHSVRPFIHELTIFKRNANG